jgi:hypothetical protein
MKNSWNIFRKSVAIVTDNLGEAFRISGAIFVAAVFASTALNVGLTGEMIVEPPNMEAVQDATGQEQLIAAGFSSEKMLALLGGNLIFFIAMSWIAIGWHRFVLLEEVSNQLFPDWRSSRVIGYSLKTLGLVFAIAFAIIIPFAVLSAVLAAAGFGAGVALMNVLLFVCFYYLFFRAGLVLPAIALDTKIRIQDSFQATKPLAGDIWGLAIIVVALVLIVGILASSFAPNNIIGVLITAVFQWVLVMISASLLTTLYGYTVERRPIS